MPNQSSLAGAEAFGGRLVSLLEHSGQRRHGAGSYLSKRYKVAGVTANAWLNGEHKAEPDMARRIAEDHGSTFDWLYFGTGEYPRAAADSRGSQLRDGYVQRRETPPGYVRFQLLDGAAGMGAGVVNQDYPEVIRELDIAEWEVRRKIGFLPAPGRIALITGRGPSMRPRIDHGDVVMVDTSVKAFDGDGVYVINAGGETQVKMLQMRADGLYVVSANPDYPPYLVSDPESIHVGGRVVSVLGLREL